MPAVGFVDLPRRREVPTKELEHLSFGFVLRDSVAVISATTPRGGDVGSFSRDHVPGVVRAPKPFRARIGPM